MLFEDPAYFEDPARVLGDVNVTLVVKCDAFLVLGRERFSIAYFSCQTEFEKAICSVTDHQKTL